MNAPIWAAWLVVGILLLISIILLSGKGSFLIAGYNMASEEEKKRYNRKKLCRVMGSGFFIITLITGVNVFYEFEVPSFIHWLFPWGIFITIAIIAILANTICIET